MPSERDLDFFVACFLHSSTQMCFVSDAWPTLATYHRPFCEHRDQGWIRAPNERALFRWRSRWFCRLMSVQDSYCRRFEVTFRSVFLKPILAHDLPSFETQFLRFLLIASGTEYYGGYLCNAKFFGNFALLLSSVSALSILKSQFALTDEIRI